MKRACALLILLCSLLLLSQHVIAAPTKPTQQATGVTVGPFLQEVVIGKADVSKSFNVMVANNTKYPQKFNILVVDFGSLDETGGLAFAGASESQLLAKYGLADWITISKPTIILEPGQKTSVEATIVNRETLSPGGHYAAVLVSVVPPDSTKPNQVNFKQTVSSLIFARKVGGERYDLRLTQVTHNGNWWRAPSKVTLRFFNPGNVYVMPRGLVKLTEGGKTTRQGVINVDSGFVLPETFRKFFVDLRSIDKPGLWLTRHVNVTVDYRYEGIESYASDTTTVRIINVPLVIAILLLLLATTVVGFWLLRRRGGTKKIRRWLAARRKSPAKSKPAVTAKPQPTPVKKPITPTVQKPTPAPKKKQKIEVKNSADNEGEKVVVKKVKKSTNNTTQTEGKNTSQKS